MLDMRSTRREDLINASERAPIETQSTAFDPLFLLPPMLNGFSPFSASVFVTSLS
jgi:hypothetical protein